MDHPELHLQNTTQPLITHYLNTAFNSITRRQSPLFVIKRLISIIIIRSFVGSSFVGLVVSITWRPVCLLSIKESTAKTNSISCILLLNNHRLLGLQLFHLHHHHHNEYNNNNSDRRYSSYTSKPYLCINVTFNARALGLVTLIVSHTWLVLLIFLKWVHILFLSGNIFIWSHRTFWFVWRGWEEGCGVAVTLVYVYLVLYIMSGVNVHFNTRKLW